MKFEIKQNENNGAVAFRRNRIKNRGIVQQSTVPLSCFIVFLMIKVENLRFSPFLLLFGSILNETPPLLYTGVHRAFVSLYI